MIHGKGAGIVQEQCSQGNCPSLRLEHRDEQWKNKPEKVTAPLFRQQERAMLCVGRPARASISGLPRRTIGLDLAVRFVSSTSRTPRLGANRRVFPTPHHRSCRQTDALAAFHKCGLVHALPTAARLKYQWHRSPDKSLVPAIRTAVEAFIVTGHSMPRCGS